jgi:hypothetical protein
VRDDRLEGASEFGHDVLGLSPQGSGVSDHPLLEHNPILSKKNEDFKRFAEIVRSMQLKEHLTTDGFRRIATMAFSMNQHGKQRRYTLEEVLAEPSETARRATVRLSDGGRYSPIPAAT